MKYNLACHVLPASPSFPTRERGLKYPSTVVRRISIIVVPHEGTWIEISNSALTDSGAAVVPHEGTWIEMANIGSPSGVLMSFPTRERGLK